MYNLVNNTNLVQNFSYHIYLFSLYVSGTYVPIIRRNNCIYAKFGICHSVCGVSCIPDSHPCRITSTKCPIDTVISPDDGSHSCPKHVEKRNKHTKKNCTSSWYYLQDYTGMQGKKKHEKKNLNSVYISFLLSKFVFTALADFEVQVTVRRDKFL